MTNTNSKPVPPKSNQNKAITLRMDRVHRSHLRQTTITTGSADRFRNFQKSFLSGKISVQTELCRFALCLICFDGICIKEDLLAAIKNRSEVFKLRNHVCIDWELRNGRIDRRYLSHFTIQALSKSSDKTLPDKELLVQINTALEGFFPPSICSIETLLKDAQAWLTQVLPGPLWGHCIGANPLAGLSRSTLARQSSCLAISVHAKENEQETSIGLGVALDGYFASQRKDSGSAVVYKIKSACQRKTALAQDRDKMRMLKECLSLSRESYETGTITSLLLAWVVDLIESGTATQTNISPATIQKYVGNVITSLFQYFRNENIECLTSENYSDLYKVILESTIPSQKQTTSAALSSWHFFLETWLDAEPLKNQLYEGIELPIPRANLIWEHEIQTMFGWLESATTDERLIQQMKVALSIATNCRIRISELLKLRLRNVQCIENKAHIEISPLRRDGQLKSISARRTMVIEDEHSVALLTEWLSRRKSEGAYSVDLLFGDPHKPDSGYRIGQLYVFLNQILKAVTGDRKARFHTLSHTWISKRFEQALIDQVASDMNPLDQLSADAGHASCQTSLTHYFHSFENPLRHHLDRSLQKSIHLTGTMVASYTKIKPAAFRQRCTRNKTAMTKVDIAWLALSESQIDMEWEAAHAKYSMIEAQAPALLHNIDSNKFSDVLKIVSDMASGLTVPIISSRSGKSEGLVKTIASLASDVLNDIHILEKSTSKRDGNSCIAELHASLDSDKTCFNFLRTQQQRLAGILKLLNASPDPVTLDMMTNSWVCCFKDGYLSMQSPANCIGLLRLLRLANVPHDCIFVCAPEDSTDTKHLASIISIFTTSGFPSPHLLRLKPRRGRPSHYLTTSGLARAVGQELGGATRSMAGFNAVMLCACIYHRLNIRICNSKSDPI